MAEVLKMCEELIATNSKLEADCAAKTSTFNQL